MSGIYGSVLPGGAIEQFGDYQEWLEDREVSNYKEFQEIWLFCFPTRNIGIPLPPLNGKRSDIEEFFLTTE